MYLYWYNDNDIDNWEMLFFKCICFSRQRFLVRMSSLGPLSWLLSGQMTLKHRSSGSWRLKPFLFVGMLKWCSVEEGDFPRVMLPVSLPGTWRSHKFEDGVCPKGLLSLILRINIAQVSNMCCRRGCELNASHRGGCRNKWGVTQLGDQNMALYKSSAISCSSVTASTGQACRW